jgi:hypothetical protein
LWELEHGPAGGDELNLVVRGGNYGYPIVSNGIHYDGRDIPNRLARVCGRTGTLAACVDAVRGRFASFADLVLAELQAAPAAAPTSSSRVVWDGTFAHPDAPSFYLLKSYALLDAQTSPEACARLPPALQADRQLLLTLTCSAENQLRAAGPDRWPDENREFEGLRRLLSSCLPDPVAGANPCARP